jgi:penicillin-binding protein 2
MKPRFHIPSARDWSLYLVLALATVIMVGRLLQLQVLSYETYVESAAENRLTRVSEPAPRGVIYDRNGVLLAQNLPSFTVTITPAFLPDDPDPTDDVDPPQTQAIYRRLSELLKMPILVPGSTPQQECRTDPPRGIKDWVDEGAGFAPYVPVKVKCDVDRETAFAIRQELDKMPGVNVIVEPVRNYPTGPLTSALVGYMARIPSETDAPLTYDYFVNQRGLLPNRDRIGVQGIEAHEQDLLAGQNGSRLIEEDVAGRFLRVVSVQTETVPGLNVQLTIDVRLQAAAEAALLRRMNWIRNFTGGNIDYTSGVAIIMNPNTGEILAMVSWPTYDNRRFARSIDYDYYVSLAGDPNANPPIPEDPDYPLINHATNILYPPGSVFKIVTATGALEEGVIDPERELDDPGKITIRNAYYPADPGKAKDFVCWIYRPPFNTEGHGKVNFTRGIAESCNVYFYKIGGGYAPDKIEGLGIDNLNKWMQIFGFGQPTGVELPAEPRGTIPTRDWKRINIGENWATGDTYNAVIGQGYVLVTPLQLLNAYNAVINRGTLYQPQLVDKYLDGEGNVITDTTPAVKNLLPVSPETIELVQTGFRRAVVEGTLSGGINLYGETDPIVNVPGINAAGKTGSAEYCDRLAWSKELCIPGKWPAHAWTVLYAPYEAPEVSVLAFVYNGTEGSKVAAPIASDLLRAYFQIYKGVSLEEPQPQPTPAPQPR